MPAKVQHFIEFLRKRRQLPLLILNLKLRSFFSSASCCVSQSRGYRRVMISSVR